MLSFHAGPVTVYAYGAAVAVAACISLFAASRGFRKADIAKGTLSWFALLAIPLSVLCGRLLYCLIRWGWFWQKGASWFFAFQEGGFVLYGALLGGLLAAWLTARITKQKSVRLLDALAAPAALMIALCRLAEGLADEGYGWDMESWFSDGGMSLFHLEDPSQLFFFPLGHFRADWETWYWAVYVAEAIFAFGLFLYLRRRREARPGDQAALFLLLYAAGQILFESMRQDSVLRWGFVRASQVLSAVAVAAVLALWSCRAASHGKTVALSWAGVIACMLVVIAMEFGVEKKIVFLEWLPIAACYLVMAAACAGMALCAMRVRKLPASGESK